MKILPLFLLVLSALSLPAQNITVTLTFTPAQAGVLSNAVEAANLAASDAYSALLADRLAENAALRLANPDAATNSLPIAPVGLTVQTYVEKLAGEQLAASTANVAAGYAAELKGRLDRLSTEQLKALRATIPKRR